MVKFVQSFLRDDSGASAAEYALILAIVGTAIAGAAIYLGEQIQGALEEAGDNVAAADTATASK